MDPDNVSSTGDLWVLAYDYGKDGAAVGQKMLRCTPVTFMARAPS